MKKTALSPSLLAHFNVKAILRCIRVESSQVDDGPESAYRAQYHPTHRVFHEGPLRGPHPRKAYPLRDGSGRVSTAFGAYQVTWTTLRDEVLALYDGVENDISPMQQDLWAVALIHRVGALEDVIDGRLHDAIVKMRTKWAALPGSPLQDGGSKVSWDRIEAIWKQYGGGAPTVVARAPAEAYVQPAAPIAETDPDGDGRPGVTIRPEAADRINAAEGRHHAARPQETGMDPITGITLATQAVPTLWDLAQRLIAIFSPVAQAKLGEAIGKPLGDSSVGNAAAAAIIESAKQLTGLPDPRHAVETVVADAKLAQLPDATRPASAGAIVASVEADAVASVERMRPVFATLAAEEDRRVQVEDDSADRASARARSEGWDMTERLVNGALAFIAFLTLLVAAVALVQVFKAGQPTTEVWAAITGLLGTAGGILATVYAYRFGRERGSTTRDIALSHFATRKA